MTKHGAKEGLTHLCKPYMYANVAPMVLGRELLFVLAYVKCIFFSVRKNLHVWGGEWSATNKTALIVTGTHIALKPQQHWSPSLYNTVRYLSFCENFLHALLSEFGDIWFGEGTRLSEDALKNDNRFDLKAQSKLQLTKAEFISVNSTHD